MSKKQKSNYQAIYLVVGILVSFFAVVALCNWGFIGVLFMNTFRLFVGEAYDLLLFGMLFYGFFLSIKGQLPKTTWKQFLGVTLILISITSLLHMREFYPGLAANSDVFKETFLIFRNEMVTSQHNMSMGGGLLGACGYIGFGYLFGNYGTYLFSGILFFLGLLLSFDIKGRAVVESFSEIVSSVTGSINSLKDKAKAKSDEVKERKLQEKEDNSTKSSQTEPVTRANKQTKNSNQSTWQSWLELWGLKKPSDKTNQSTNRKTTHPDIYDSDYEPSFKGKTLDELVKNDEDKSFELVSPNEPVVLDLDYFDKDELKDQHENEPIRKTNKVEITNNAQTQQESPPKETTSDSKEDKDEKNPIPPVDRSNENKLDPNSINQADTASRWQDQANLAHSLTDDGVDEALKSASFNQNQPVKAKKNQGYQLPPKSLLNEIKPVDQSQEYEQINKNIQVLDQTFASFNVDAKVVKANLGPAVTKYEVEPGVGVKVSRIVNLADDIALALAARDVRIEAPIPGKSLIGIEVPNRQVSPVAFSEVIDAGLKSDNLLEVPLGRDVSGVICMADLTKMPHLLIAGATGSGKSVGINVIICSILMKAHPDDVKLLLIDPKKVELALYDEIPHLVSPVVTNPRKAAQSLNKIVKEMENRYELFAQFGVRNIDGYNDHIDEYNRENGTGYQRLPKIVVIIDELADLMMVASNDVENAIIRLAQMARAAGIHMIIATQRPSVDVITGIIKANIPSRLAFAVTSGTDSRTILDSNGAEKLLGRGDMLFQPMGKSQPQRVQGAYISDEEVERITNFIKDQAGPDYDEDMVISEEEDLATSISDDEYFLDAIEFIKGEENVSISQLQRKFRIGYNRAARIIDDLEALGYVSEQDGSRPRDVLVDTD